MRYLIIFSFVFFLLGSFLGAEEFKLIESLPGQVLVQWKMSEYRVTPYTDGYVLVEFPGGCGTFGDGTPSLPSQQIFVEVPKDVRGTVEIVQSVSEKMTISQQVYPSQPCPTDTVGQGNEPRAFVKDEKVYASDSAFPGTVAHLVSHGIMRGRNLAVLRVNPFQYVPKTGEMTVYKELLLKVTYPPTREQIADTDDGMDPIAKGLVLNYIPGSKRYRDVEYLIIAHDDYLNEMRGFAQWKEHQGFMTKMVSLSSITDLAAPSATAIKNEVNKYYPGLKYLLLVGDANQIPLPKSARGEDPELYANSTPSDLCYALLEGTDYYPDIHVGRIPANTVAQAAIMINKILFYERTPDTGNWYNRFLLCGEFQYQYSKTNTAERLFCETAYVIHRSLGHLYTFATQTIGTGSSGLGHTEYFFRKETYRHKIKDPNGMNCKMPPEWAVNIKSDSEAKQNTLAFWREGAFLVQHRDHGGETLWGKPGLNRNDVSSLENGRKLPVLFSINCLTGAIDYSSGDCFVEAALKNPNGGAVAALGASRVSYSWWNDTLCDGFYTCLYGPSVYDCMRDKANPPSGQPALSTRLAEIMNYGKMYLLANYPDNPWNADYNEIEFYLFHCFGTPDMMIRTAPPTMIEVSFPAVLKSGNHASLLVTNKAKSPVANAMVCFHQNGILHVAHTNERGELSVALQAKGKVKVTVTGHNLYPFEGEVEVD